MNEILLVSQGEMPWGETRSTEIHKSTFLSEKLEKLGNARIYGKCRNYTEFFKLLGIIENNEIFGFHRISIGNKYVFPYDFHVLRD